MATRARIGIELTELEATSVGADIRNDDYWDTRQGTILSSYQHWDGYPAALGYTLFKHYGDREKLLGAIELGDASVWGAEVSPDKNKDHTFDSPQPNVNVYYGRDRGEYTENCKPIQFVDHEEFQQHFACAGEEYAYLLRLDGTWSIFDYNSDRTDGVDAIERIIRERVNMENRMKQLAA